MTAIDALDPAWPVDEQPEPAPIYDHLVGQRGDPDAVFAGVDLVSMPQFTYSCDTEGATA